MQPLRVVTLIGKSESILWGQTDPKINACCGCSWPFMEAGGLVSLGNGPIMFGTLTLIRGEQMLPPRITATCLDLHLFLCMYAWCNGKTAFLRDNWVHAEEFCCKVPSPVDDTGTQLLLNIFLHRKVSWKKCIVFEERLLCFTQYYR